MIRLLRHIVAAILAFLLSLPVFSNSYGPVGNRTQMTSTLAPVPAGTFNYDANDRFTIGDGYDANGNTTVSGGLGYVYDFENHLIQQGGLSIAYDGDGNRVSKVVAGTTTTYLVDTENPTGYAQVVTEGTGSFNSAKTVYVYGLERISQNRRFASSNPISYYVYDGHGSVRALTDPTGAVTDTYDYDAFGNLIHSSTTLSSPTPNNYLFAGEQFDPDLGLYYNRARYLNTSTGRFWSMDSYEGNTQDPLSLHKYLYVEADPADATDPTGRSLSNLVYGGIVHTRIGEDFIDGGPDRFSDTSINTILRVNFPLGNLRPDLTDRATQEVYEIKPVASAALGYPQLAGYLIALNQNDPLKRVWVPGATYLPPRRIDLGGGVIALVSPPVGGVIIYEVFNPVEIFGLAAIAIRLAVPSLEADFGAATLEEIF